MVTPLFRLPHSCVHLSFHPLQIWLILRQINMQPSSSLIIHQLCQYASWSSSNFLKSLVEKNNLWIHIANSRTITVSHQPKSMALSRHTKVNHSHQINVWYILPTVCHENQLYKRWNIHITHGKT